MKSNAAVFACAELWCDSAEAPMNPPLNLQLPLIIRARRRDLRVPRLCWPQSIAEVRSGVFLEGRSPSTPPWGESEGVARRGVLAPRQLHVGVFDCVRRSCNSISFPRTFAIQTYPSRGSKLPLRPPPGKSAWRRICRECSMGLSPVENIVVSGARYAHPRYSLFSPFAVLPPPAPGGGRTAKPHAPAGLCPAPARGRSPLDPAAQPPYARGAKPP